ERADGLADDVAADAKRGGDVALGGDLIAGPEAVREDVPAQRIGELTGQTSVHRETRDPTAKLVHWLRQFTNASFGCQCALRLFVVAAICRVVDCYQERCLDLATRPEPGA